ncbi:MAG: urease subunit gamma [Helicobacteraceae bacterium]|nr:urease subunit gamma [Helicobacteraceae bacterium]
METIEGNIFLTKREREGTLIFSAAQMGFGKKNRGIKLNSEAAVIINSLTIKGTREGTNVMELMSPLRHC